MSKYHYFYVIENLVNGKLYGGKHSTDDFDDGYMGSGKLLKQAVKKHGIKNFRKHVLKMCESAEEAFWIENQIVDEEFVNDPNTYNLIVGGDSFAAINANETLRKEKNSRAAVAMNKMVWADPSFCARRSQTMHELLVRLHDEGTIRPPNWTGRHHKQSSKVAIGVANSVRQRGEGNSQHGTVWISNHVEKVSRKVRKQDVQRWLEQGWVAGRKMKW